MKSFVHRHLWQRLPREARRAALLQWSARLAGRPDPEPSGGMPVFVAGALTTASGLGESARLCVDALSGAGVPVYGCDLTGTLMQPSDHHYAFPEGRPRSGAGTLLLHVNAPFVPLAMLRLGRSALRGKRVIGYWAWELPQAPPEWRRGVSFVHEIWVPSHFVAAALEPIAEGRPIRVVPHPVALGFRPSAARAATPGRPFTVLTIFNMASSFARKNPAAVIAAFRAAFGDHRGARLIVKLCNPAVFPQGVRRIGEAIAGAHNVVLMDETLTGDQMDALYREADIFVSLHRAEGFGLTIAEAMLRGLPVVATGWSGNMDFMNDENSVPVPYGLVPASDLQGTYEEPDTLWADPDVGAAADALRRLFRDDALRSRLGRRAAADALRFFSPAGYAAAFRSLH